MTGGMQRAVRLFTQDHFVSAWLHVFRLMVSLTNTRPTDDIKSIASFALTAVIAWGIDTNVSFSTGLVRG